MYITLEDRQEYTTDFLNYLKKRMLIVGLEYVGQKRQKLIKTDQYLSTYLFKGTRKVNSYQIILSGLKNITFKKANSKVIISINESIKIPYSTTTSLSALCQLIDQGNLELNPFPVFTHVFKYAKEKITDVYSQYTFGVPL